ncbi:MAG: septum site-determining protein MinD, partial [Spirochaetes bacterium]
VYPFALQDVLTGKVNVKDAPYYHEGGFRVIPADISLQKLMIPESQGLLNVLYKFVGKCDFMLVDTAAGIGKEACEVIKAVDELILVTNPEISSVVDALKVMQIAEKYGTKPLGIVVNRVCGGTHEMSISEIEDFFGLHILGIVHESTKIRKYVAEKRPVVIAEPHSLPAKQFKQIAANLLGIEYSIKRGFFERLFGWWK